MYLYFFLYLIIKKIATKKVNTSAIGTANQTPVTPRNTGRTNNPIIINPNVLKNEIVADTFPFDKAVNIEDVKIFIPENKKLYL